MSVDRALQMVSEPGNRQGAGIGAGQSNGSRHPSLPMEWKQTSEPANGMEADIRAGQWNWNRHQDLPREWKRASDPGFNPEDIGWYWLLFQVSDYLYFN